MDTASILVVCTGNVRRSPAIEAMLRHGIGSVPGLGDFPISVTSAGVRALVGQPIDDYVLRHLDSLGISAADHVAQQISAEMIEAADLILTAERAQRSVVVSLSPAAVRRTFTLRELAALGGCVGRTTLGGPGVDIATRMVELVRRAPLERARRALRTANTDDLPDLRRPSDRAARKLLSDVASSVCTLLELLEPDPSLTLTRHRAGADGTGEQRSAV